MAKKDSFVLYNSYYDVIENLTMEQRGALFTAILQHVCGEEQEKNWIQSLKLRIA